MEALNRIRKRQIDLAAFSTVISIVDRVSLSKRRRVLRHFVRSQLNQRDSISDEDSLHYAICKHLPTLVSSTLFSLLLSNNKDGTRIFQDKC